MTFIRFQKIIVILTKIDSTNITQWEKPTKNKTEETKKKKINGETEIYTKNLLIIIQCYSF